MLAKLKLNNKLLAELLVSFGQMLTIWKVKVVKFVLKIGLKKLAIVDRGLIKFGKGWTGFFRKDCQPQRRLKIVFLLSTKIAI